MKVTFEIVVEVDAPETTKKLLETVSGNKVEGKWQVISARVVKERKNKTKTQTNEYAEKATKKVLHQGPHH